MSFASGWTGTNALMEQAEKRFSPTIKKEYMEIDNHFYDLKKKVEYKKALKRRRARFKSMSQPPK